MDKPNVESTDSRQHDEGAASSGRHQRRSTHPAEFLFYFLIVLLLLMLGVILNGALREAWQWLSRF